MKKIILPLAVFMFGLANAQEAEKVKSSTDVKYGVKFGLNVSTISGDNDDDVNSSVSIHGGFVVEIPVAEKFSVQPELIYSMQGAKSEGIIDVEGTPFNVEEHLKLSYLNIPVMAKYYVTPEFTIMAGPQIGFLTSAKDKFEFNDGEGNSGSDTIDVKDELKSIDFALGVGLGYSFTKEIFAELRMNAGLSNISDDNSVDMKNNVVQLSLGYRFN